jgi:hypothetical protein
VVLGTLEMDPGQEQVHAPCAKLRDIVRVETTTSALPVLPTLRLLLALRRLSTAFASLGICLQVPSVSFALPMGTVKADI